MLNATPLATVNMKAAESKCLLDTPELALPGADMRGCGVVGGSVRTLRRIRGSISAFSAAITFSVERQPYISVHHPISGENSVAPADIAPITIAIPRFL